MSRFCRLSLVLFCLAVLAASSVPAGADPSESSQPTAAPGAPGAPAHRIEVRTTPILDLYYYVRACAADSSIPRADLPGLAAAIEHVKALQEKLGSMMAWGILDANLIGCMTATEAESIFVRLPESRRFLSADQPLVMIRQEAIQLGRELAAMEPAFLENVWPEHERRIAEARQSIARRLEPRQKECFEHIERWIGGRVPDRLVYYIVAYSPPPHGVTHRTPSGIASIIGVDLGGGESLLIEAVLHEGLHVVDALDPNTILGELRRKLIGAGLEQGSNPLRDIVHTLFFVHGGEMVRRLIDPEHRDYGDVAGYYAKVPGIPEIERPIWTAYLDGHTSRSEVLDEIVRVLANP